MFREVGELASGTSNLALQGAQASGAALACLRP